MLGSLGAKLPPEEALPCGRPPKEAQNTAPVQQIQPARGPRSQVIRMIDWRMYGWLFKACRGSGSKQRLQSLLEPQWLRMWMTLLLVMCVMVVMVMAL